MKIGVLTLPMHGNIGGVLQNYALIQVLKEYTNEVYTIDYRPYKHEIIKAYIFRGIRKLGLKKIVFYSRSKKLSLLYNIRAFIDNNIPCTDIYSNFKELKAGTSNFDFVIVGSDQVWRKIFIYNSIDIYYLGFVDKKQQCCFSYAASFGTDKCEYSSEELLHINELIKDFKSVSVREYSALNLIKKIFKWNCKTPQLVLDPTLLLSMEKYLELISNSKVVINNKRNIFYYILDNSDDKEIIINKFREATNLDVISSYNSNKNICSIEQWLSDIYHSEFVITDSFHGVVFSIIFKKQFAVFINKERGTARFDSILKLFKLENRIIRNNVNALLLNKIDYNEVTEILIHYQNISKEFIASNIKNS